MPTDVPIAYLTCGRCGLDQTRTALTPETNQCDHCRRPLFRADFAEFFLKLKPPPWARFEFHQGRPDSFEVRATLVDSMVRGLQAWSARRVDEGYLERIDGKSRYLFDVAHQLVTGLYLEWAKGAYRVD